MQAHESHKNAQTALDNSILIDEADPDAIALDNIGSDYSIDEDAVPVRKVTTNNKVSFAGVTQVGGKS